MNKETTTTKKTTPPQAARTYRVNSLDRGLGVLRTIRNADGPVRNRDIVTQTGLPKATVSRLVHTLTALGYLRRTDQGCYVLGPASSRTGRAMLQGLQLEKYAPLLQDVLTGTDAYAQLVMPIENEMIPVYLWTSTASRLVNTRTALNNPLIAACAQYQAHSGQPSGHIDTVIQQQLSDLQWCHEWNRNTQLFVACTGVQLDSVAQFVLSVHLPAPTALSLAQLTSVGATLRRTANAIASESPAVSRTSL